MNPLQDDIKKMDDTVRRFYSIDSGVAIAWRHIKARLEAIDAIAEELRCIGATYWADRLSTPEQKDTTP